MKFRFVRDFSTFLGYIFCILSLNNCEFSNTNNDVMLVAVAASTLNVMDTLAESFYQKTGHKIEIIHGSSGKIATQITQSAPYSIFFSADEFHPDFLAQKKLNATEPKIYAQGKLAIWFRTIEGSDTSIMALLQNNNIQKIALANPSMAPYGKAAYAWLKDVSLLNKIEGKLIFGESIAQLNTYIFAETVDAAFTSLSSLKFPANKPNGHLLTLSEKESPPIQQAVIVTKFGEEYFPEQSLSFLNFVFSESGKAILKKYGYSYPEN